MVSNEATQKQLAALQEKLEAAEKTEELNEHGIAKNSRLHIHCIEAKDLESLDLMSWSDPYLQVLFESYDKKTAKISDSKHPVWDEKFVFEVKEGKQNVKFVVWDHDPGFEDDFNGECEVALETLADQKEHDLEVNLTHKGKVFGKLHVKMTYIWSYVVKYKAEIQELGANWSITSLTFKLNH